MFMANQQSILTIFELDCHSFVGAFHEEPRPQIGVSLTAISSSLEH